VVPHPGRHDQGVVRQAQVFAAAGRASHKHFASVEIEVVHLAEHDAGVPLPSQDGAKRGRDLAG
jgi:hypothetical protein